MYENTKEMMGKLLEVLVGIISSILVSSLSKVCSTKPVSQQSANVDG